MLEITMREKLITTKSLILFVVFFLMSLSLFVVSLYSFHGFVSSFNSNYVFEINNFFASVPAITITFFMLLLVSLFMVLSYNSVVVFYFLSLFLLSTGLLILELFSKNINLGFNFASKAISIPFLNYLIIFMPLFTLFFILKKMLEESPRKKRFPKVKFVPHIVFILLFIFFLINNPLEIGHFDESGYGSAGLFIFFGPILIISIIISIIMKRQSKSKEDVIVKD
jgi:hypothetical protein